LTTQLARGIVGCNECQAHHCLECKKPGHKGACPVEEKSDEEIEAMMRQIGAQRCPGCRKFVVKPVAATP